MCLMPVSAVTSSSLGLVAGEREGGLMVLILIREEVVAVLLEGDSGGLGWDLLVGVITLVKADLSADCLRP